MNGIFLLINKTQWQQLSVKRSDKYDEFNNKQ
jgi:hypothetical protein